MEEIINLIFCILFIIGPQIFFPETPVDGRCVYTRTIK